MAIIDVKTVKQVSAKTLSSAFKKNNNQRLVLSISALYHSVVNANIDFVAGWQRTDTTMLDTTLRQLMPVAWVKGDETKGTRAGYKFSKAKAAEVQKELNVEFQNESFESFVVKVLDYWNLHSDKVKTKELTLEESQEAMRKRGKYLVKAWADSGIPLGELELLIKQAREGKL